MADAPLLRQPARALATATAEADGGAGWPVALDRVTHAYAAGRPVLADLSFSIRSDRFVAIVGPSGAGKSTVLRLVNGLLKPSAGAVRVGGADLTRASAGEARRLRRRIGMVFQQFGLINRLSVLENVMLGRLGYRTCLASSVGWIRRPQRELALHILDRVGMADFAWSRADQLSGGQRQRVGIARALAQEPRLILADEPISALDPRTAAQVMDLLADISRTEGIAVIANLHALQAVRDYADRVIGLRGGRLVFDGSPAALHGDTVHDLYGAPPHGNPSPAALDRITA